MSKLLDRLHIHHGAPETLHETTEKVPESAEVAEHRLRVTAPPSHAASKVRWLRWVSVVALFAAGILAVTMLVSDDTTDEPAMGIVGYPATGPGSTSLGPTPVLAPIMGEVGYPATGPGSTSLGPTPVLAPIMGEVGYPATGPGSTSLGPTPVLAPIMGEVGYPATGPGSTSLGPTPVLAPAIGDVGYRG